MHTYLPEPTLHEPCFMECETEIEIMYIKVVVDREVLIELDKLNFVYVLNGVDMLEKIRAQV